jgi:hypothetical protein
VFAASLPPADLRDVAGEAIVLPVLLLMLLVVVGG